MDQDRKNSGNLKRMLETGQRILDTGHWMANQVSGIKHPASSICYQES